MTYTVILFYNQNILHKRGRKKNLDVTAICYLRIALAHPKLMTKLVPVLFFAGKE